MSLITRCPACTTIFKVVPDQLRVSEGWVRCGQCDEVFDANAHLQTALPLEVVEQTTQEPQAPEPVGQQPIEVAPEYDWSGVVSSDVAPAPAEAAGALVTVTTQPEPEAPEPALIKDQNQDPDQVPLETDIPADALLAISPGLPAEALVPPTFMRDAATPLSQNWGQRHAQWVWGACAGLLLVLLVAQWGMQERDRISANAPGVKPLLDSVCAAAGCKIAPMHSIDAVVIDSSAFSKLQGDVYQLSFSLKSTASVEIATPSLELTLTDMQDQPVVRRVLSASELGRPSPSLMAGTDWTGARTLVLTPSPAVARVTGYRLLAFYP